jgi:hypothetical protein
MLLLLPLLLWLLLTFLLNLVQSLFQCSDALLIILALIGCKSDLGTPRTLLQNDRTRLLLLLAGLGRSLLLSLLLLLSQGSQPVELVGIAGATAATTAGGVGPGGCITSAFGRIGLLKAFEKAALKVVKVMFKRCAVLLVYVE